MDLKKRHKYNNGLITKVVKEEPSEFKGNKAEWRYQIQKDVFDLYDAVADNAKMIALLFALLSRIYKALPEDIKLRIPKEDREMIEFAFALYKAIKTRADVQFSEEGEKFIRKLFKRQAQIANIINGNVNDLSVIDKIEIPDLSELYTSTTDSKNNK